MFASRHVRWCMASLLLILVATPATAQGPGKGPGGPPSGGPPGGPPPGGRPGPQFDILALEGPPTPQDFVKVTGATPDQESGYVALYDAYQKDTRATRDSAQLAQQNITAAIDHGRREAVPPLFAMLNATGKTLDEQLQAFDQQVKKLLPKDQWKRYEKGEKERRKAMKAEMEAMLPKGGPGGPGGRGGQRPP